MSDMPASKKVLVGTIKHELASRAVKEKGRDLAQALRGALPASFGYFLLLSEGDGVAFFTDWDRATAIRSLRAVLQRLEASE